MFLFSGGCPSAYIKQSLFIHSTSGNGGKPVKKIPASATVLPTMKVEVQSPYNRISISHNRKRLRETSDRLCREYGLSVIENPKKAPSRPLYLDEKSGKPTRYNVYLEDLAEAISGSRDIPHMMKYLIDKGYEVDFSGGHWKMKLPQYKHFTRLDTLDERLTPDFIRSHLGTRARYGNYKAKISYSPHMPEEYKKAWKPHQKTRGILSV